jgi:hypothetical protein
MQGDFKAIRSRSGSKPLLEKLMDYIDRETKGVQWQHYVAFAEELRE